LLDKNSSEVCSAAGHVIISVREITRPQPKHAVKPTRRVSKKIVAPK
jgi:hypothetical protein